MLSIQVYPVMDGVEIWAAGTCTGRQGCEPPHPSDKASSYISRERIDRNGLEAALGFEVSLMLTEFPGLARVARC